MCDIFLKEDAKKLLADKNILLFGDSNIRAMYKDLLWLINHNSLIDNFRLKKKLEPSFLGDKLVKYGQLNKGRNFQEVREYKHDGVRVEFFFLTKCYSKDVEDILAAVKGNTKPTPDLIVMNSCLWDITRWGPSGVDDYKDNLVKLMRLLKSSLPKTTLVVWLTALPVSGSCKGGFLVKQVEFFKHMLRFEIMEANMFARQVVVSHGFDILDNHYFMRMQIHRRADDGIHWLPVPLRHMTNLLLTHVALSWDCTLPGNFYGPSLDRMKNLDLHTEVKELEFPQVPDSQKKVNSLKRRERRRKPVKPDWKKSDQHPAPHWDSFINPVDALNMNLYDGQIHYDHESGLHYPDEDNNLNDCTEDNILRYNDDEHILDYHDYLDEGPRLDYDKNNLVVDRVYDDSQIIEGHNKYGEPIYRSDLHIQDNQPYPLNHPFSLPERPCQPLDHSYHLPDHPRPLHMHSLPPLIQHCSSRAHPLPPSSERPLASNWCRSRGRGRGKGKKRGCGRGNIGPVRQKYIGNKNRPTPYGI